jgi:hypothetical protein
MTFQDIIFDNAVRDRRQLFYHYYQSLMISKYKKYKHI